MRYNLSDKRHADVFENHVLLPFPLQIVEGKKLKKKCCRKFKKGKRCKRCPGRKGKD